MITNYTSRGFGISNFKDSRGMDCTVQESSNAGLNCIWLGAKEVQVQVMTNNGWQVVDFSKLCIDNQFVGNQRMHLSQENVKELLPTLQYFAEHGCLPTNEEV